MRSKTSKATLVLMLGVGGAVSPAAASYAVEATPSSQVSINAAEALIEVLPEVPTEITDNPGWKEDKIVAPDDTDSITYKTQSLSKLGLHYVVATAKDGYVFSVKAIKEAGYYVEDDTQETTKQATYVVQMEHSPEQVKPEMPTIVDKPGWKQDSVTFPQNTDKITYKGQYNRRLGQWVMITYPIKGYVINDEDRVLMGNLEVPPMPVEIEPSVPTVIDKPGYVNDKVIAPKNTDKITYKLNYNQKLGKWSLTATIVDNEKYVLPGGLTTDTIEGDLDVSVEPTIPDIIETGYVDEKDLLDIKTEIIAYGALSFFAFSLFGVLAGNALSSFIAFIWRKRGK